MVKNVIMLRTPQLLVHFLLEEFGSVGCYATSTEIFKNFVSQFFFARRDIGIIALADGFCSVVKFFANVVAASKT